MRLHVRFGVDHPTHRWMKSQELYMEASPGLTYAEYLRQAEVEAQGWGYPFATRLTRVALTNDQYVHIATLLKEN